MLIGKRVDLWVVDCWLASILSLPLEVVDAFDEELEVVSVGEVFDMDLLYPIFPSPERASFGANWLKGRPGSQVEV